MSDWNKTIQSDEFKALSRKPAPTTDRDELVEEIDRIMSIQRNERGDMLYYGEADEWLGRIKARIQADAATIAAKDAALNDAIATIAAVRASAASPEWAESGSHFYHVCGDTLRRIKELQSSAALKGDNHG